MADLQVPPVTPIGADSENVKTNQVIVTSDGIELVADLYIPAGEPPFPAIIEITPYSAQQQSKLGEIYATRGFLYVAVDARGRYRSAGEWKPMEHDQKDGHDVIRWVAKHQLCNGRIGTRGHSYCAFNQLLAAINAPTALQAMVVCVPPGDPFSNVPFHGGAYDINDFFWLLSMTGRVCDDGGGDEYFGIKRFGAEEFEENPYEQEVVEEKEQPDATNLKQIQTLRNNLTRALTSRPFAEMDLQFGVRQDQFREWIAHWQFDDYWQTRSVMEHLEKTDVPTLHISGWWDVNGRGATAFYRGMRDQAKTATTREKQRLLMGAWNHDLQAPDCSDLPGEEAAQIERAALRDELNDEFAWFDEHLMDLKPGPSTNARVSLYLTGLYQWFEFDDWPPVDSETRPYYLVTDKNENNGTLQQLSSDGVSISSVYRFDPEKPTPYWAKDLVCDRAPFDNSILAAQRKDILTFDTPIVESQLALVGEVSAILYVSADVTDFDLYARLLDVYPDGRAIYLTDGIIRARFRDGWEKPVRIQPGEIYCFTVDLWHIGHVIREGHALRLEIASSALGRFDVNPCTGGDLATETSCQVANITIHHNTTYPSHLLLPICSDKRVSNGMA